MNFTFHPDEAGWIGRKRVFYPILGLVRGGDGCGTVEGLIGKYSAVKGKGDGFINIFRGISIFPCVCIWRRIV